MKPKTHRFAPPSAALCIALVASPLAGAADGTWTQLTTDGLWSDTGNWSGGTEADGSGFTANFSTLNLAADNTVKMDASHILTALTFQDTTTPFFKWTLDNNGNAANILTLAGTTPSITVGASTTATISAEIAGSTDWSKAGTGTLILTGNNTTTGNVSVGGGTSSVLSFNTIADKNVSSALGAGTTISVTASNSGLTYTGGVASSNRDFVLNNTKTLFSNTGGGLLTLSGGVSTSGTTGSLQLRSGNVELSGVFTGAGFPSVNSSSSTLTLSNAANDFTNPLDIFSGTISVSSIADQGVASAAGKGTTINIAGGTNAGKLVYTGGASTNTRIIGLYGTTGTATIDQSGEGLLKFTNSLTATGVGSKTLTLQGSLTGTGEIGGAIVNNSTTGSTVSTAASTASTALVLGSVDGLTVGDPISGTGIAGGATITAINTATKTVTLSAVATVATAAAITSTGLVNLTSVTKAGTNTWTLSGVNTYSGRTTVNGGVLQIANNNGLGGTAAGTVVNGTTGSVNFVGTVLDLNGVSISSGESLTLASGTTSGHRVTLRTVGTTTNTWAGGVSLTGSRLVQLTANTGGQLEISGAITHSSFTGTQLSLRGAGTGILSGGVTLDSATNITVNDGGTWNINTTGNTWGATNAYRGTLVLGANDALPTTTSLNLGGDGNSGTLKLNGKSQTVAGLTTTGTGTANKVVNGNATAGALTINNSTANAFDGVLGGIGTDENNFSLTKSGVGSLTLSAANTYSGDTTVTEGTLTLGNPNANNESSTVTIAATAATLELNFDETGGPVTDTVDKLFIGAVQQNAGVYKATDNVTDAGTPIAQITGPGTLTVTSSPSASSPYDTWAASKGLTAGNKAKDLDPDNDGRNNLGEFAFNGDPLSGSDNGKVFALTEDSDYVGDPSSAKELILTVAVRSGTPVFAGSPSPSANFVADGITYNIEGSLTLGSFLTPVNVVPTPVVTGLPPAGAGYEYRSFSLDGSNGLTGKGFLRAKVTSP